MTTATSHGYMPRVPATHGITRMAWTLLPSIGAPRQPWRNGGGTTRQIAIWPPQAPPDACTWRVSAADVDRAGDFSDWSGYDRHLEVTHGAGIRLVDKESAKALLLRRGDVLDFPGERIYAYTTLDGPVRDCNVMVRRAWGAARTETIAGSGGVSIGRGFSLLYCIGGAVVVHGAGMGDETRLNALDALQFPERTTAEETEIRITAELPNARCIAIHIRPHATE